MKKIPFTFISLIIIIAFALIFAFVVPQGGNLISENGDTVLGLIVGILFGVSLLLDFRNLHPHYKKFVADNPEGYWFKRKWYGWGWTPVTWQGWLATLIYIGLVVGFALTIDDNSPTREIVFTFLLPVLLLTISFIRIAYVKGEKPKWQWGPKD